MYLEFSLYFLLCAKEQKKMYIQLRNSENHPLVFIISNLIHLHQTCPVLVPVESYLSAKSSSSPDQAQLMQIFRST